MTMCSPWLNDPGPWPDDYIAPRAFVLGYQYARAVALNHGGSEKFLPDGANSWYYGRICDPWPATLEGKLFREGIELANSFIYKDMPEEICL